MHSRTVANVMWCVQTEKFRAKLSSDSMSVWLCRDVFHFHGKFVLLEVRPLLLLHRHSLSHIHTHTYTLSLSFEVTIKQSVKAFVNLRVFPFGRGCRCKNQNQWFASKFNSFKLTPSETSLFMSPFDIRSKILPIFFSVFISFFLSSLFRWVEFHSIKDAFLKRKLCCCCCIWIRVLA